MYGMDGFGPKGKEQPLTFRTVCFLMLLSQTVLGDGFTIIIVRAIYCRLDTVVFLCLSLSGHYHLNPFSVVNSIEQPSQTGIWVIKAPPSPLINTISVSCLRDA